MDLIPPKASRFRELPGFPVRAYVFRDGPGRWLAIAIDSRREHATLASITFDWPSALARSYELIKWLNEAHDWLEYQSSQLAASYGVSRELLAPVVEEV